MNKSDFVPDKKYFVQADGQGLGINMIFWLCSPMFCIAAHHGGGGRPTSRRDGAEVAAFIRMEEKV